MNMKKEILINCSDYETRIAIVEDDRLVELYIERPQSERLVGNIYKGKIKTVLPGMQAAFIDIGYEKAAFLHAADVLSGFDYSIFGEELEDTVPINLPIEDLLQEGELVFQRVVSVSILVLRWKAELAEDLPIDCHLAQGRQVSLHVDSDYAIHMAPVRKP